MQTILRSCVPSGCDLPNLPLVPGGDGPWAKGKITGVFKRMKRRRAVPQGCIRKELWELALEQTTGLAENIQGMFNGMYAQNTCPIEWNHAESVQLGKANGKKGMRSHTSHELTRT